MLKNTIRYGIAGLIGAAAIIIGSVSVGVLKVNNAKAYPTGETSVSSSDDSKEKELAFLRENFGDLIDKDYGFDPEAVKFSQDDHPYKGLKQAQYNTALGGNSVTYSTKERTDSDGNPLHICYYFEGSTAEGWQGDYSLKKAFLTLWEDGLYVGSSNGSRILGYWFNQAGDGSDCLMLMDGADENKHDMVCNRHKGDSFYQWDVDVLASYNGGRMIKASGFAYYPAVAMYIDTGDDELKYNVGDTIDASNWVAKQVRGGGEKIFAGGIFDASNEVKYTFPSTAEAGEKEVTAKWNGLETTVKVTILEGQPATAE